MRPNLPAIGALLAVALLAPNAFADGADDGEGVETANVQGSWVPTSRESDDWATLPAPPPPVGAAKPIPTLIVTTPAATSSPPVAHSDDQQSSEKDPHEGLLGILRIGALAGVGAPSIFSGEGLAKIGDWVGLTGDYGTAPSLSLPIGNGAATISQTTVSAGARVFPFRGAFFVGGSVGQQTVSAKVTQSAEGVTGGASFSTKAMFVEPQIGFLYRFAFGLAIGCDAGLQIPVTASGQSSATDNVALPAQLSTAMNYAEKGVIPSLNLLRLGYVL